MLLPVGPGEDFCYDLAEGECCTDDDCVEVAELQRNLPDVDLRHRSLRIHA